MAHLLTYGSLMFEDVWKKLVKGDYAFEKATLEGYARRCVQNEEYPVIFEAKESVEGVVYFNISEEDMALLDNFEGVFYERKSLEVIGKEAQRIAVEAYVLKACYAHIIDNRHWSEAHFKEEGIKLFLEEYKGFRT